MSTVEIGQVWRDCDKRMKNRYIKVVRLDEPVDGEGQWFAIVQRCWEDGRIISGRQTRINFERMKPGATGYELVGRPLAKERSA